MEKECYFTGLRSFTSKKTGEVYCVCTLLTGEETTTFFITTTLYNKIGQMGLKYLQKVKGKFDMDFRTKQLNLLDLIA